MNDIVSLQAQLALKQSDWIEACKDITKLEEENERLRDKNKKLVSDLKFAMSFAPKEKATKGLDPTFYFTLSYEGDKKLDERIEQINQTLKEIKDTNES
jgi:hypothetical protein